MPSLTQRRGITSSWVHERICETPRVEKSGTLSEFEVQYGHWKASAISNTKP